jgi:hypothetical protein
VTPQQQCASCAAQILRPGACLAPAAKPAAAVVVLCSLRQHLGCSRECPRAVPQRPLPVVSCPDISCAHVLTHLRRWSTSTCAALARTTQQCASTQATSTTATHTPGWHTSTADSPARMQECGGLAGAGQPATSSVMQQLQQLVASRVQRHQQPSCCCCCSSWYADAEQLASLAVSCCGQFVSGSCCSLSSCRVL